MVATRTAMAVGIKDDRNEEVLTAWLGEQARPVVLLFDNAEDPINASVKEFVSCLVRISMAKWEDQMVPARVKVQRTVKAVCSAL